MTSTQLAFAFFLVVVAPGFGLCGALACEKTRLRWFGGFVVTIGAAWAGLIVAGGVAAITYPQYPLIGPPEHTAMLYLVPPHMVGMAVVLLLARFAPLREGDRRAMGRVTVISLVALLILSAFVAVALRWLLVPLPHRALPWGARDVQEETRDVEPFLPDYSYQLQARMSADQFEAYVSEVGMTPHTKDRVYEDDAHWLPSPGPIQRDKTKAASQQRGQQSTKYVWQAGDEWVAAVYEDGWLYLSANNH